MNSIPSGGIHVSQQLHVVQIEENQEISSKIYM